MPTGYRYLEYLERMFPYPLAIFAPLSDAIISLISVATISNQAWTKLATLYASQSKVRIMDLKDKLTDANKGDNHYWVHVYSAQWMDWLLSMFILMMMMLLHVLHGLRKESKDVCTIVWNCKFSWPLKSFMMHWLNMKGPLKEKKLTQTTHLSCYQLLSKIKGAHQSLIQEIIQQRYQSKGTMNPISDCQHGHQSCNQNHSKLQSNMVCQLWQTWP